MKNIPNITDIINVDCSFYVLSNAIQAGITLCRCKSVYRIYTQMKKIETYHKQVILYLIKIIFFLGKLKKEVFYSDTCSGGSCRYATNTQHVTQHTYMHMNIPIYLTQFSQQHRILNLKADSSSHAKN